MRSARPRLAVLVLIALAGVPARAPAQQIDPSWLAFPGERRHPSSAASAGLALADRWLGEAPFDNPAIEPQRHVEVSPALVRVSRQDLRARNRDYDETPAFLDLAGGWLVVPVGALAVFAYADQPVLRLETSAFRVGLDTPDPGAAPPGTVALDFATREIRAGAGAAWGRGRWRAGLAGEWTMRKDRYEATIETGAPTGNGTALAEFSGDGFGAQAGGRVAIDVRRPGDLVLGAGVRRSPEISFEDLPAELARRAGWEGGLSARFAAGAATRLYAALGGAGARPWRGLGVTSGAASAWSVAIEFHDARDPWTVRFGLGQEHQSDVPEPRAGRVALGLGWVFGGTTLDVAAVRRNLQRSNLPDSYDDRIIATVRTRF